MSQTEQPDPEASPVPAAGNEPAQAGPGNQPPQDTAVPAGEPQPPLEAAVGPDLPMETVAGEPQPPVEEAAGTAGLAADGAAGDEAGGVPDDIELEEELQPWPERPAGEQNTALHQEGTRETGQDTQARAQATADLRAALVAAELAGEPGADATSDLALPRSQAQVDLEPRIREIGMALYEAMLERGPAKTLSSFVSGRALQRRVMAQTMADPAFKTQLFRFVDVYPSIRDSGDLVRHLRDYLGNVEVPRPLDRLVATDKRRLPGWAVTRLTERGMQRMAETLIAGQDATGALPALKRLRRRHTGFTLDILGEACLSDAEAEEYARRYHDLLDYLPQRAARWGDDPIVDESPYGPDPRVNVSLKVSSLYSQIDPLDFDGSRGALVSALKPLFLKAREKGAFLTLDIERFIHRDLTYAAFADLCRDPELRDWPHLGIVVQAYLRDSAEIVQGLVYLAKDRGTPFTVRLVKGAYWDYETILAAQEHWPPPVFLKKPETDVQFERLAKKLVDNWQWTRPALGTHNIRSIAVGIAAAEAAGLPPQAVEVQVLHGMADAIRQAAVKQGYRVREYVPVGDLIPGMAYLVRRLLENTANESFLRATFAEHSDVEKLLVPPARKLGAQEPSTEEPAAQTDEAITAAQAEEATTPAPVGRAHTEEDATQGSRPSSGGAQAPRCAPFQNEPHADFSREPNREAMRKAVITIAASAGREYPALIGGEAVQTGEWITSTNPARPSEVVGKVVVAGRAEADRALASAVAAFPLWRDTPVAERADILLKAAVAMRQDRFGLAALEVLEAGKPWREADADVCEAIDFLEYYAREALRLSNVWQLSDVPGESDLLFYEPRGVAVVVAPWNFPLAIPTGMVSAALAAGNAVVFKPASPTPVLGYALVRTLHEAGVPGEVLGFLPGPGGDLGDYLVADPRVDLIAFTGSLDVGTRIMEQAAGAKPGQRNIKQVITEMGGKNAIIVDSDADLDAAVEGTITSAFGFAGQKCSACSRVIVHEGIYDQFLGRLSQAALSLKTGDPADPATRVGPVISAGARDGILRYIENGKQEAALIVPAPDGDTTAAGEATTSAGTAPPIERPASEPNRATAAPADSQETTLDLPESLSAAEEDLPADETAAAGERTPAGAAGAADAGAPAGEGASKVASGTPEHKGPLATAGFEGVDPDAPVPLMEEQDPPEEDVAPGTGGDVPHAGDQVEPAEEPPADRAATDVQALEDEKPALQSRPAAGHVTSGYFIPPHIFADVPPTASIAQEEIFGPVLAVMRAATFEEALRLALDVKYGLTGGLYSRNPAHIMQAAREFRVGNLYINRPITGAIVGRQPFGGSRMSGVGSKAGGPDYLLQFMEPRVVTENTIRRGFAPDTPMQ